MGDAIAPASWESSNLSVATIENGNELHIVGAGDTTITARITDDSTTERAGTLDVTVARKTVYLTGPISACPYTGEKVYDGASSMAFSFNSSNISLSGVVNTDDVSLYWDSGLSMVLISTAMWVPTRLSG